MVNFSGGNLLLCRRRKESSGSWVRRASEVEENANEVQIEDIEMCFDSDVEVVI